MKKRGPLFYLLPILGIFVVLCVILYFFHPLAPLLLLASIIIQAPIIFFISKVSIDSGYRDRLYERKQQYKIDGDTEAFLDKEEKEAQSVFFKILNKSSRRQNLLTRAELLHTLSRGEEGRTLLAEIDPGKLSPLDLDRYNAVNQEKP